MRRRSFDLGDQAHGVANGELAQAIGQRTESIARGGVERGEQTIERSVLAEEQNLVLAAEVVIEVGRREVGGDRDIAHAGGGETAAAEDLCGGAQDVHAPRFGADRTAVRKLNHRSILADPRVVGRSFQARQAPLKGPPHGEPDWRLVQNGPGQACGIPLPSVTKALLMADPIADL